MNKEGKKSLIVGVVFGLIFVLAVAVFATAADASDSGASEEAKVFEKAKSEIDNKDVPENTKKYVEKFVEKMGVEVEEINNVTEVDVNNLPEDVDIENVDEANIAIYEIDYDEDQNPDKNKEVFVITYSSEELDDQGDLLVTKSRRQFLSFGSGSEISDAFLETASGAVGSFNGGYVMMRSGGITGISTNLNVVNSGGGEVGIIIYKNGDSVMFGNSLDSSSGIQKDYDLQSRNVVTFEPGDVISVYVSTPQGVSVKDVITMIEITTVD